MIGDTASKRWRFAINIMAVLAAFSILLSGWALYDRFSETNRVRVRNAQIWHAVICDIERAVIHNKKISKQRREEILRFYDNLLVRDAHAAPCGLNITGR